MFPQVGMANVMLVDSVEKRFFAIELMKSGAAGETRGKTGDVNRKSAPGSVHFCWETHGNSGDGNMDNNLKPAGFCETEGTEP